MLEAPIDDGFCLAAGVVEVVCSEKAERKTKRRKEERKQKRSKKSRKRGNY